MKSLLVFVLCIGLLVPGVYAYPRHVDPTVAEETVPDPEMMFNLYYLMFQGMVSGDFTISDEWLAYAQELSYYPDLFSLLEEYNGLINIEITSLNLTMFYFDQVFVELNNLRLDLAQDSYIIGLEYLRQGNATLPLIVDSTGKISEELEYSPENVYEALKELEGFIDGYEELAVIIDNIIAGGSPSSDDLEIITDYLNDIFPGFPGSSVFSSDAEFFELLDKLVSGESLSSDEIEVIEEYLIDNRPILPDDAEFFELLDKLVSGESLSSDDLELIGVYLDDIYAGSFYIPGFEDFPGFEDYILAMIENPVYPFSLTPTRVSISVNSSEVYVGDSVVLSGQLSGVSGVKSVQVFFDGAPRTVVQTDEVGGFEYVFRASHHGLDTLSIYAMYWPSGQDTAEYLPSQSNAVSVSLMYFTPNIEFGHASVAFPGLPFAVDGQVGYMGEGLGGVPVYVSLLGDVVSSITDANGGFHIEMTVNPVGASGNHSLVIGTRWYEAYEPVSRESLVEVRRLASILRVDSPGWALSGSSVRVSGIVTSDVGLLDNCTVNLYGAGETLSTLTDDGDFSISVPMDLLSFSSNLEYRVEAIPLETYIDPDAVSLETRVVNSFSLLAIIGVVSSVVYLARKLKVSPPVKRETDLRTVVTVSNEGVVHIEEDTPSSLYNRSLGLVSGKTGVEPRDSQTIREYLDEVRDLVDSYLFRVFEELSFRYERWLYDRPMPVDLDSLRKLWRRIMGDESEK